MSSSLVNPMSLGPAVQRDYQQLISYFQSLGVNDVNIMFDTQTRSFVINLPQEKRDWFDIKIVNAPPQVIQAGGYNGISISPTDKFYQYLYKQQITSELSKQGININPSDINLQVQNGKLVGININNPNVQAKITDSGIEFLLFGSTGNNANSNAQNAPKGYQLPSPKHIPALNDAFIPDISGLNVIGTNEGYKFSYNPPKGNAINYSPKVLVPLNDALIPDISGLRITGTNEGYKFSYNPIQPQKIESPVKATDIKNILQSQPNIPLGNITNTHTTSINPNPPEYKGITAEIQDFGKSITNNSPLQYPVDFVLGAALSPIGLVETVAMPKQTADFFKGLITKPTETFQQMKSYYSENKGALAATVGMLLSPVLAKNIKIESIPMANEGFEGTRLAIGDRTIAYRLYNPEAGAEYGLGSPGKSVNFVLGRAVSDLDLNVSGLYQSKADIRDTFISLKNFGTEKFGGEAEAFKSLVNVVNKTYKPAVEIKPQKFELTGFSERFNPEVAQASKQFLQARTGEIDEIYGSHVIKSYLGESFSRQPHDIDLMLSHNEATKAQAFANDFAKTINQAYGKQIAITNEYKVISKQGDTIADIHLKNEPDNTINLRIGEGDKLFGQKPPGPVVSEKLPLQNLGKAELSKAESIAGLRMSEQDYYFSPARYRAKDVSDFLEIAQYVAEKKGIDIKADLEILKSNLAKKGLLTNEGEANIENALGIYKQFKANESISSPLLNRPSFTIPRASLPPDSIPSEYSISISSNKPSVSISKPSISISQPSISISKPSQSKPSISLSEPSISLSKPSVSLSKPSVSFNKPSISISKPSLSKPSVSINKPSISEPSISLSNPSISQPSISISEPSVSLPDYKISLPNYSLPKFYTSPPASITSINQQSMNFKQKNRELRILGIRGQKEGIYGEKEFKEWKFRF